MRNILRLVSLGLMVVGDLMTRSPLADALRYLGLAYLVFDNNFSYAPSDLNGDIAVTTVAVDAAARRGIIVVTAAANEGPAFRTIWTPADADSGLAIGAEDSLGNIAFFSSRGMTARYEPTELVSLVPGHL